MESLRMSVVVSICTSSMRCRGARLSAIARERPGRLRTALWPRSLAPGVRGPLPEFRRELSGMETRPFAAAPWARSFWRALRVARSEFKNTGVMVSKWARRG